MVNKIKRTTSFVLVFCLIIAGFAFVASAADAKAVLTFKVSDDGYAIVADCKESAQGVVSIPSKATVNKKTYSVKYIGDKAFDKCKLLTEIHIPEGVTAIGSFAFRNCSALKNIYMPESLIRCELDAFDGCGALTVHCYMLTYQFISLDGINSKVTFNVIDAPLPDENTETDEDDLADIGFIGKFINALKNMINSILERFGANDDDFSIEDLPFDLPFEIPEEESDNPFLDLL